MIDTHWALAQWTWHWDREGTKESFGSQHRKLLWSAEEVVQGDERRGDGKCSGRDGREPGPPSRAAPAPPATVCSSPHGPLPSSTHRAQKAGGAVVILQARRHQHVRGAQDCTGMRTASVSVPELLLLPCPEGLVTANGANLPPLQCCGTAMVNAHQK